MIRKKSLPEQQELWVCREQIQHGKGSGFLDQLAADLDKEGFGDFVRELCAPYYCQESGGRPPIDPEVYFKMLFVGFHEGIGSERGIAGRCEDSLSIRRFLRYDLTERTPNHSSLSVIRRRLPAEVFDEVFSFSHRPLLKAGLLKGERLGVDSSITEANASLEKLERREDGKSYQDYIGELAEAEEGIDPKDHEAVQRFDRKRKGKKISNEEWVSPNDPDAKIGPRKDGAWDMIHKVENVVDLDSGALVSVEVQPADKTDSDGMAAHFETAVAMVDYAQENVSSSEDREAEESGAGPEQRRKEAPHMEGEVESSSSGEEQQQDESRKAMGVGDKGYHKQKELAELSRIGIDAVIAEPAGRKIPKDPEAAAAFERNRENKATDEGRQGMRDRAEKVERSFRHLLDHGGARRTTLCGHEEIRKRTLMAAFAFNLSIYSWHVHGVGTLKQHKAGNRNRKVAKGALIARITATKAAIRYLIALIGPNNEKGRCEDENLPPRSKVTPKFSHQLAA